MLNQKFSKKEVRFLRKNLKRLDKKLKKNEKKIGTDKKSTNQIVFKFMNYKIKDKEQDSINLKKIIKSGKNKDSFYFKITELGEKNKDFYKKDNLFEYTKKNWEFQKKHFKIDSINAIQYQMKKDYPDLKEGTEDYTKQVNTLTNEIIDNQNSIYGEEYTKFYSWGSWCRWVDDKKLVYGSIDSIESYFFDEISEIVRKKVEDLIPSVITHAPGKEFSNVSDTKYFEWNIETRANGREEELDKLNLKLYKFEKQFVKDHITNICNQLSGKTFVHKILDRNNYISHIYIPDTETAKKIKTKTFLKDVYKLEQPFKLVENLIKKTILDNNFEEEIMKIYELNHNTL